MDQNVIITQIVEKIKKYFQPEKIIVFGSFAWGNPTRDSDLDLFIIKDTKEKPRKRALEVRRIISEENAFVGIDILVYTPEEFRKRMEMGDSFLSKIMKKGKVMYA
ncbi:MAG: nucleotidyltransferase domain-containing protein [Nitrospinae bacterium]|nr:nucleotidyltransferase domain-containing protein [Nitrospinota bacterium]MBI3813100.1 nucleotidyltransferase domain-containing protein [Nitrospinota bacterium]